MTTLSTFLLLSKEYFMSLMLDLWMDITYIDEGTIKAIQLGVTLGVIITTTLIYFPGTYESVLPQYVSRYFISPFKGLHTHDII